MAADTTNKRKVADAPTESAESDGKRRLGDSGAHVLAVGLHVGKDGTTQQVGDNPVLWEGLVLNVPATVFQEEDPEGYYMGNVRAAATSRHPPTLSHSARAMKGRAVARGR
jgi:hypothetical protein